MAIFWYKISKKWLNPQDEEINPYEFAFFEEQSYFDFVNWKNWVISWINWSQEL